MANQMDSGKKRKKRHYTSKHSTELINIALEALRKKTLSSYEAEKVFGIPRRTLLDKLHNKHPKKPGGPTRLSDDEESNIVKVIIAAAEYGSPLTLLDLRAVVHRYLEANGRLHIFNDKLPGKKWVYSFIKRHKSKLSYRMVQNIKRSRAEKKSDEMIEYFRNLKSSLEDVPSENILNYDETNLSDNPGTQKCLFKRGVKYPERVLNATKGSISVMFAITAGSECLPPYVVYKAEHLYTQWTLNGPRGARFNRSKSGWFDTTIFEDWFKSVVVPWAKTKTGTKVLIGDNLASHINHEIVTYCQQNDIRFVFLPPNSTHITQPLDVCYFGPLKKLWREILTNYKIKNPREATINKGHFPELLKKLMDLLSDKTSNIISAFKSTGIAPYDPEKVINKLIPDSDHPTCTIDNALLDWLKENRSADPNKKTRNKKINVIPGKSVSTEDIQNLNKKTNNVQKANKTKNQNAKTKKQTKVFSKSTPQVNSLIPKNPDSLKKLCTMVVNDHLLQSVQDTVTSSSQSSNVSLLSKALKNDKSNRPFSNEIPESLQTKKSKIVITSDVTIPAVRSERHKQSKNDKFKCIMKGAKITRSALRLKIVPIKKETREKKRKYLKGNAHETKVDETGEIESKIVEKTAHETKVEETGEIERKIVIKSAHETKEEFKNKKPNARSLKRKIKENVKQTATQKRKSVKRKIKRQSSEYSSTNSDNDMHMADTDDSDYATFNDYIAATFQEEQENIDPLIEDIQTLNKETKNVQQAYKTKNQNEKAKNQTIVFSKSTPQVNSLVPKYPDSLKKLCTMVVNNNLLQSVQNTVTSSSQSSNVSLLSKALKNGKSNRPFINEIPECLQTNKSKIAISSDVTMPAVRSERNKQSKKGKIKCISKGAKITRSALRLELVPIKKETRGRETKDLKGIAHEIKEEQTGEIESKIVEKTGNEIKEEFKDIKRNARSLKRKIKENVKQTATRKHKSVKQRIKRQSSEYSSTNSDNNMHMADTDDSDYATFEDYIAATFQEEQENVDPSIPYGLSEIKYLLEENKVFNTDSWILAKFVTKKSLKHFVGKVISIKDNIPDVKFVRKVKDSKFNKGSAFTYPRVDDVCTMKHLDDIVLVLPEPDITRRGQIIFHVDFSAYNVQ